MEIRHIRYFVALAEELHFGRAAQRLRISQPPLSQQIKALEDEVGARLFDRTKHKVALTRSGKAVLAEAYRLLEQAERLRSVARQTQSHSVSRLAIGCVSSALFDVLPPVLDEFHAHNPDIGVFLNSFESNAAVTALLQSELDVAIVRVTSVPAPLKMRSVMHDWLIAALPPGHSLTRQQTLPLASLANEPLIIYSRQISPRPHDTIIAACLKAGFSPNLAYQSDSIQTQIGLVACGLGIALVPGLTRRWRVPRVVYRELESRVPATDLSLVWNPVVRSVPVERFLQTVPKVPASIAIDRSTIRQKR